MKVEPDNLSLLSPTSLNMTTHLKLLLIALFASLAFNQSLCVFLSIDCGSSESYTDENSIEWVGDDAYIQSGESKVVPFSSWAPYPMSTLRVFPTRKKNCYTIKVDQGERVLVRASFLYDNYDDKSSPPVFDLQFDGNFWATVNNSDSFGVISHEVIYVVKRNFTSICVAQTDPGQLPFISALEIRSLGSNMYSNVSPNYAMRFVLRSAFGANETDIRYPVDPYDRIWEAATGRFPLSIETNEAASIKVTAVDNPPPYVLKNAVVSSSTSTSIRIYNYLPEKPTPFYMATYFSEVTQQLNPTQKRSFKLYIDSKAVSASIVPPFAAASEAFVANRIASSSNTFTLKADDDSTLPPLINAMELYTLTGELTNGTNTKDVGGLALLQKTFDVLQGWSGDPCLPSPYTWDWLDCNSDAVPRVTALNLSGYGLAGSLPDFSSMNALQTIDLSDNNFDGPIPDFLGKFPNLTLLNLSNNRFNGSIPSSLSKNKKLKLSVAGNCLNSTSCPARAPKTSPTTSPDPSSPSNTDPSPTTDSSSPPQTGPETSTSSPSKKSPTTTTSSHQILTPPSPFQYEVPPLAFQEFQPNSANCRTSNNLAMILGFIIQLSLSLSLLMRKF